MAAFTGCSPETGFAACFLRTARPRRTYILPTGQIIRVFQSRSQGYYVLWAECDIMVTWAGRECRSPFAMFAVIAGYRRVRIRRTAPRKNVAQRSGTRAAV